MAYFTSPCQRNILIKTDAAPMPTLILSTYLTDYISPQLRHAESSKKLVAKSKPPDYLPEDTGKRILPTSFRDVYRNCVSASIGELLELEFQDDTPDWKRKNRAAAARHWILPLSERRQFIRTQEWYLRKNTVTTGGNKDGVQKENEVDLVEDDTVPVDIVECM